MVRKKTKGKLGSDHLGWVKDSREAKEPETQEGTEENPEKPLVERGLPDGWQRWAVIVRQDYLKKVRAYTYWERMDIKDVLDEALDAYFKGKRVKPMPEGK